MKSQIRIDRRNLLLEGTRSLRTSAGRTAFYRRFFFDSAIGFLATAGLLCIIGALIISETGAADTAALLSLETPGQAFIFLGRLMFEQVPFIAAFSLWFGAMSGLLAAGKHSSVK